MNKNPVCLEEHGHDHLRAKIRHSFIVLSLNRMMSGGCRKMNDMEHPNLEQVCDGIVKLKVPSSIRFVRSSVLANAKKNILREYQLKARFEMHNHGTQLMVYNVLSKSQDLLIPSSTYGFVHPNDTKILDIFCPNYRSSSARDTSVLILATMCKVTNLDHPCDLPSFWHQIVYVTSEAFVEVFKIKLLPPLPEEEDILGFLTAYEGNICESKDDSNNNNCSNNNIVENDTTEDSDGDYLPDSDASGDGFSQSDKTIVRSCKNLHELSPLLTKSYLNFTNLCSGMSCIAIVFYLYILQKLLRTVEYSVNFWSKS